MSNFIRVEQIDKSLDFINLIVTLKGVNAKSREDMLDICKKGLFDFENLTSNIQIHSDIVNKVDEKNIGSKKEGDALITNLKNVPLLVFTADCVPIAIIDKNKKSIGLVHAGWRGSYEKIPKKAIDSMISAYKTNPNDLICIIGPSIGKCCYEVSKELIEKFKIIIPNKNEEFYKIENGRYYLDLWKVNEIILMDSGVKKENIINLNICTSCQSDKFHSYRKHNKTPERIGMILQIK